MKRRNGTGPPRRISAARISPAGVIVGNPGSKPHSGNPHGIARTIRKSRSDRQELPIPEGVGLATALVRARNDPLGAARFAAASYGIAGCRSASPLLQFYGSSRTYASVKGKYGVAADRPGEAQFGSCRGHYDHSGRGAGLADPRSD